LKITIIQGAFLPVPPLRGGAVERVWFALGKEFAKEGHCVTHISRCCDGLPEAETVDSVKHVRVAGYDAPRSTILMKVLDLLYSLRVLKHIRRADIVVTNTFWLPILLRAKQYGAVYVHVARFPKGQMFLYRGAARLQTVSTAVARAMIEQTPSIASKVRVVPYPVPPELCGDDFDFDEANQRQKWILYSGRVHPEKGLPILLAAFGKILRRFPDWQLKIVGPWQIEFGGGGKQYLDFLKQSSADFSDNVEWVGMVANGEMLRQYYLNSSIFVYPSVAAFGETFGLAPLEAMANGCPPVVSDLDCFKDFIEDGVSGLIFNHRAAKAEYLLMEKLDLLVGSPELLSSFKAASLETAKKYSLKNVCRMYLRDFESVLGLTT
jgi:glycosyltransferase involved in cell wall biosynthesis